MVVLFFKTVATSSPGTGTSTLWGLPTLVSRWLSRNPIPEPTVWVNGKPISSCTAKELRSKLVTMPTGWALYFRQTQPHHFEWVDLATATPGETLHRLWVPSKNTDRLKRAAARLQNAQTGVYIPLCKNPFQHARSILHPRVHGDELALQAAAKHFKENVIVLHLENGKITEKHHYFHGEEDQRALVITYSNSETTSHYQCLKHQPKGHPAHVFKGYYIDQPLSPDKAFPTPNDSHSLFDAFFCAHQLLNQENNIPQTKSLWQQFLAWGTKSAAQTAGPWTEEAAQQHRESEYPESILIRERICQQLKMEVASTLQSAGCPAELLTPGKSKPQIFCQGFDLGIDHTGKPYDLAYEQEEDRKRMQLALIAALQLCEMGINAAGYYHPRTMQESQRTQDQRFQDMGDGELHIGDNGDAMVKLPDGQAVPLSPDELAQTPYKGPGEYTVGIQRHPVTNQLALKIQTATFEAQPGHAPLASESSTDVWALGFGAPRPTDDASVFGAPVPNPARHPVATQRYGVSFTPGAPSVPEIELVQRTWTVPLENQAPPSAPLPPQPFCEVPPTPLPREIPHPSEPTPEILPFLFAQADTQPVSAPVVPAPVHAMGTPACDVYQFKSTPPAPASNAMALAQILTAPTPVDVSESLVYSDLGPFGTNIPGGDPLPSITASAQFATQVPAMIQQLHEQGLISDLGAHQLQADLPQLAQYQHCLAKGPFSAQATGKALQAFRTEFKKHDTQTKYLWEKKQKEAYYYTLSLPRPIGTLLEYSASLIRHIQTLQPGETLTLPIGYVLQESGHAMGLVIRMRKDRKIDIAVVNPGDGRNTLSAHPHPIEQRFTHHVMATLGIVELSRALPSILLIATTTGVGDVAGIYEALGPHRQKSSFATRTQLQNNCFDEVQREFRAWFLPPDQPQFSLITFLEALWRLQNWVQSLSAEQKQKDQTQLVVRDAINALALDLERLDQPLITPAFVTQTATYLEALHDEILVLPQAKQLAAPPVIDAKALSSDTPYLAPTTPALDHIGPYPPTPQTFDTVLQADRLRNPDTFIAELDRASNFYNSAFSTAIRSFSIPLDRPQYFAKIAWTVSQLPPISDPFWDKVDVTSKTLVESFERIATALMDLQYFAQMDPDASKGYPFYADFPLAVSALQTILFSYLDRLACRHPKFGEKYAQHQPSMGSSPFHQDQRVFEILESFPSVNLAQKMSETTRYFEQRTASASKEPVFQFKKNSPHSDAIFTYEEFERLPIVRIFGRDAIKEASGTKYDSDQFDRSGHKESAWLHVLLTGQSCMSSLFFNTEKYIKDLPYDYEKSIQAEIRLSFEETDQVSLDVKPVRHRLEKNQNPDTIPPFYDTKAKSVAEVVLPQLRPKGQLSESHYLDYSQARLGPDGAARLLDWAWDNHLLLSTDQEAQLTFERQFFRLTPAFQHNLQENSLFFEKFTSLINFMVSRAVFFQDDLLMIRACSWLTQFWNMVSSLSYQAPSRDCVTQTFSQLKTFAEHHPALSTSPIWVTTQLQLLHHQGISTMEDFMTWYTLSTQFNLLYTEEIARRHVAASANGFIALLSLRDDVRQFITGKPAPDLQDFEARVSLQLGLATPHPVRFDFEQQSLVCGPSTLSLGTGEWFTNGVSEATRKRDLLGNPVIQDWMKTKRLNTLQLRGPLFDTAAKMDVYFMDADPDTKIANTPAFTLASLIYSPAFQDKKLDFLIGRPISVNKQTLIICQIRYVADDVVYLVLNNDKTIALTRIGSHILAILDDSCYFPNQIQVVSHPSSEKHPQVSLVDHLHTLEKQHKPLQNLVGQTLRFHTLYNTTEGEYRVTGVGKENAVRLETVTSVELTHTQTHAKKTVQIVEKEYGGERFSIFPEEASLQSEPFSTSKAAIAASVAVLSLIPPDQPILGYTGNAQFIDAKTTNLPPHLRYIAEHSYRMFIGQDGLYCQDHQGEFHFKIQNTSPGMSRLFRLTLSGEHTQELIPMSALESAAPELKAMLDTQLSDSKMTDPRDIWVFRDCKTQALSIVLPKLKLSFSLVEQDGHYVLNCNEHQGYQLHHSQDPSLIPGLSTRIILQNESGQRIIIVPTYQIDASHFKGLAKQTQLDPEKPLPAGRPYEIFTISPLDEVIPNFGDVESVLFLALLFFRTKNYGLADRLIESCFTTGQPLSERAIALTQGFTDPQLSDQHPFAQTIVKKVTHLQNDQLPLPLNPMPHAQDYRPMYLHPGMSSSVLRPAQTMPVPPRLFADHEAILSHLTSRFSSQTVLPSDHPGQFAKSSVHDQQGKPATHLAMTQDRQHHSDFMRTPFQDHRLSDTDLPSYLLHCKQEGQQLDLQCQKEANEILEKLAHDQTQCDKATPSQYRERLHRLTQFQAPLTWTTLFRLAAMGNLAAYQIYFPYFTQTDCEKLHADLLHLKSGYVLLAQTQRVIAALQGSGSDADKIQLAGELLQPRTLSEQDVLLPFLLELEHARDIKLRDPQLRLTRDLATATSDTFAQLMMGGGKTIGCVITALAHLDGQTAVVVMTAENLLPQTMNQFRVNFGHTERSVIQLELQCLESENQGEDLLKALNTHISNVNHAILKGWPVFCDAKTYQLLLVSRAAYHQKRLQSHPQDHAHPLFKAVCERLDRLADFFHNAIVISDEADTTFDPSVEFIRSEGRLMPLPTARVDFSKRFLTLLESFANQYPDHPSMHIHRDLQGTFLMAEFIGQEAGALQEKFEAYVIAQILSPTKTQFPQHQALFTAFLNGTLISSQVPLLQHAFEGLKNPALVATLKLTAKYLSYTQMDLKYLRDYGPFPTLDGQQQFTLAQPIVRPYTFVNTPEGEQTFHQDPDLRVYLTRSALYRHGITPGMLVGFLQNIVQLLNTSEGATKTKLVGQIRQWLSGVSELDDEEVCTFLSRLVVDSALRDTTYSEGHLQRHRALLDHYFELICAVQLQIQPLSIYSVPWDLQTGFQRLLATSGTTQDSDTWLEEIRIKQHKEAPVFLSGLLTQTQHPPVLTFDESHPIMPQLQAFIPPSENVVFIDEGGCVMMKPDDVARQLLSKFPNLGQVHYFEDGLSKTQVQTASEGQQTLRFYSHKDTIGTDAKNKEATCSVITVSAQSSYESFVQAVLRVREHTSQLPEAVRSGAPSPHRIQVVCAHQLMTSIRRDLQKPEGDISVADTVLWLRIKGKNEARQHYFSATKGQLYHRLILESENILRDPSRHSVEHYREATQIRVQAQPLQPEDMPIEESVVEPKLCLQHLLEHYRKSFPNLMSKAVQKDMQAIIDKASKSLPLRLELRSSQKSVHQTQTTVEVASQVATHTQIRRQTQVSSDLPRSETTWDPMSIFSEDFFADLPPSKPVKGIPNCFVSDNFACPIATQPCTEDKQPLLRGHFVLMKWDETDQVHTLIVSQNEALQIRRAFAQYTGPAPKMVLLNLNEALTTFDAHDQSGLFKTSTPGVTPGDLLTDTMVERMIKLKLYLGLPLETDRVIGRKMYPQDGQCLSEKTALSNLFERMKPENRTTLMGWYTRQWLRRGGSEQELGAGVVSATYAVYR